MNTIDNRIEPYKVLKEFYISKGIKNDDVYGKRIAMSEAVVFPENRKPALYELEELFLHEKGYKI
jgi:hypothetical protein